MDSKEIEERLRQKLVRPTANRILVYRALLETHAPQTLADLVDKLVYMDKSSVFRVLTLFADNDVVHSFEDGRGVVNYELCRDHAECHHHDWHMHFYCEQCHRCYCLQDIPIENVPLPKGFQAHTLSFVIKGICSNCNAFALLFSIMFIV